MHRNTKVATCCYCGTRAALVLSADHHVLVCASCGAPLGELKQMPMAAAPARDPAPPEWLQPQKPKPKPKAKKKKKKGKTAARLAWKLMDEIGDIFD